MTIYMIWSLDPMSNELTLVDAWDEESISGNDPGWEEAKKKAYDTFGAQNIRIATTEINEGAIHHAFEDVKV